MAYLYRVKREGAIVPESYRHINKNTNLTKKLYLDKLRTYYESLRRRLR